MAYDMDPGSRAPSSSLDALTELAYQELRRVAHRHLSAHGGASVHRTLDTTALVHEAYLKLAGPSGSSGSSGSSAPANSTEASADSSGQSGATGAWRDEAHFRAVASVAMRHILVDRARSRAAQRHGGGFKQVTLDEHAIAADDEPETLLAIDAACARLAETSPRLARLVELRFFGALSETEVANELGVTLRTVQRDWAKARALLAIALAP